MGETRSEKTAAQVLHEAIEETVKLLVARKLSPNLLRQEMIHCYSLGYSAAMRCCGPESSQFKPPVEGE